MNTRTAPAPDDLDQPIPYTLTPKAHTALANAPEPDDYLPPQGHYQEAQRLLWVIDGELQSDRPRTIGELAVIALAHAVTALAGATPR